MTHYKLCPCCGTKRLLYIIQEKRWTCFHCFKTMVKAIR